MIKIKIRSNDNKLLGMQITFIRKLVYSLLPLIVFLVFLSSVEILFHIIDIPSTTYKDLFDADVELKSSSDTGFTLVANLTHGLDKNTGRISGDAFDIGCFGDSTTFGSGAVKKFSFPNQLQSLFDEYAPEMKVKVHNLGVPAFTSEQGKRKYLKLIEHNVFELIIVGYGFNDGQFAFWTDRNALDSANRLKRFKWFIDHVRLIRAAHEGLRIIKTKKKKTIRRVPPEDYISNFETIIMNQKQRNGLVVLINLEFGNNYSHKMIKNIAEKYHIPFIDMFDQFQMKQWQLNFILAEKMNLSPALTGDISSIVMRLYLPGCSGDEQIKLGYLSEEVMDRDFNIIDCSDNGKKPDEYGNDCIWTVTVPFNQSKPFHYIYMKKSGDGLSSEFPGFDKPGDSLRYWHTRIAFPEYCSERGIPINVFGQRSLKSEYIHPNAKGYRLIAEKLFETIIKMMKSKMEGHK